MHLSKNVIKKHSASERVLEYTPQKFELATPDQAIDYLQRKEGSDFEMSEVIRVQTGVDNIETLSLEEKIEQGILEKIKDIQEKAYQEAYQLGLDEGRSEAFQQSSREINERLDEFEGMLKNIANLKRDLMSFNESHLVRLTFHMASRLAMHELKANESSILDVLRTAIERVQDEENIEIRVSNEQFDFVETLKTESKRELEVFKNVKFVADEGISVGGCVIETNYGEIDARLEERVHKLWEAIFDAMPKVKDKVAS
jgi:flagellar assembly protein FliH